jgi:predicted amidophosphoribosyltransferase
MLGLFLRCIACQESLNSKFDRPSFPLCKPCADSLVTSPPLCSVCGGPSCSHQCERIWAKRSAIDSYSARYVLFEQSYQVLKSWKIHGGTLFHKQVLRPEKHLSKIWSELIADAIIPIPQHMLRAWSRGGCRTETIAEYVKAQTGVKVLNHALQISRSLFGKKRQGTLNLNDRYVNPVQFEPDQKVLRDIKRVILVDDIMTSGRTVNQAACALKSVGVADVHVFCLGIRPFRLLDEKNEGKSFS